MATARRDLDRAIDDYLSYLRVERGLADATIRAYRGDLRDFEQDIATGHEAWDRSADAAVRYLAARTRRGQPGSGRWRRRASAGAAALKGFYRSAFGEGIIEVDVATHRPAPAEPPLPDTLDVGEVERLLEAASSGGVRDRALLELLYAAGLRVSEAIGLDREDLSLDGAFVRVIGKGDKERLVPIGEISIDHLGAGWTDHDRQLARHHVEPVRGGPCSWATGDDASRVSRRGQRSTRRRTEPGSVVG